MYSSGTHHRRHAAYPTSSSEHYGSSSRPRARRQDSYADRIDYHLQNSHSRASNAESYRMGSPDRFDVDSRTARSYILGDAASKAVHDFFPYRGNQASSLIDTDGEAYDRVAYTRRNSYDGLSLSAGNCEEVNGELAKALQSMKQLGIHDEDVKIHELYPPHNHRYVSIGGVDADAWTDEPGASYKSVYSSYPSRSYSPPPVEDDYIFRKMKHTTSDEFGDMLASEGRSRKSHREIESEAASTRYDIYHQRTADKYSERPYSIRNTDTGAEYSSHYGQRSDRLRQLNRELGYQESDFYRSSKEIRERPPSVDDDYPAFY